MTRPAWRDDILARKRDGLAHDQALVNTRRRAALDYFSAREQKSRPQLVGDLIQRFCQHFCQRSRAMSSTLDRVDSLEQVPAVVAR